MPGQGFRPLNSEQKEETVATTWAAQVEMPSYDADMLLQWRVVKWALWYMTRCVMRRFASALALQGVDDLMREHDDIDEHEAYLQKRWNHQVRVAPHYFCTAACFVARVCACLTHTSR